MSLFRFYILCLLIVLPASGCAGMVGGPCTYETLYGVARISEQVGDETLARFTPQKRLDEDSPLLTFRSLEFPVHLPVAGGIGTVYPAALRVRTKGSCTPGTMRLLATEEYSSSTVIKLNKNGQILPAEQLKLSQMAMIFKKLASSWPQMRLEICGQTSSEGTEEYNLNLGDHHARKIALEFETLGVPHSQIKTSSSGEHPCPRSVTFFEEPQNGACLSFVLSNTPNEKK